MGFDSDGLIQALDCKVWCLGGTVLDICFSDIAGVMTGLNQVGSAEPDCSMVAEQAGEMKAVTVGKYQPTASLPRMGGTTRAGKLASAKLLL